MVPKNSSFQYVAGELETFLNNKYEEIRVIEERLGKIPEHITVIPADTSYDPRSGSKFARR